MRLRSRRRDLMVWSPSARATGLYGAPPFTHSRWIRTGTLLAVIALMRVVHAGRARWRLLLVAAALTAIDVVVHGGLSVLILLFLASAAFIPARPAAERVRHSEQERELGVCSHPAQRRFAIQAMNLQDHRFPVSGRH